MKSNQDDIERLVSVPTEMEANLIVNVLLERQIQAHAVGGFTSGFRAEAPGEVQVLVHAADLPAAQKILREYENRP